MPIAISLTKKEDLIIRLIHSLDSFKEAKQNYDLRKELPQNFQQAIETLLKLSKYSANKKKCLLNVAFAYPVDYAYVRDHTDAVANRNTKIISKKCFSDFTNQCPNDSYLYFGFSKKSDKNFNLGYIKHDCRDDACAFQPWEGENCSNDPTEVEPEKDSKLKRGVIHKKDEFDNFLSQIAEDSSIYLHRRKYKLGKGGDKLPNQTVVLSDKDTITQFSRLENKGGSCCPPEY